VKLPSGSDFSLELDLAHDIVPAQSKTRLMSTKVPCDIPKYTSVALDHDHNKVFPYTIQTFSSIIRSLESK